MKWKYIAYNKRWFPSKGVLVLESSPQVRTVKILGKFRRLTFPYNIFLLHHRRRLFSKRVKFSYFSWGFSREPIRSIDDRIYRPAFPGAAGGLSICLGGSLYGEWFPNLKQLAEVAVNQFWFSEFNHSPVLDVEVWEKIAFNFPEEILEMDWEWMPDSYPLRFLAAFNLAAEQKGLVWHKYS